MAETPDNAKKAQEKLEPSSVSGEALDEATAQFIIGASPSAPVSGKYDRTFGAGWFLAITRFHRIPVFKRVWFYLFMMAVYTTVVDVFVDRNAAHTAIKEAGAAGYTSIVLGLLLVFRTNTAYERWSEGRKLWGQLVNDSRTICFKVRSFVNVPESEKIHLGQLVISFSYALKHHLRKSTPTEPLPGLGPSVQGVKHMPVHVTSKIFDLLQTWRQAGQLDNLQLIQLDAHLRAFMDICGGCERIKNSPISVSYRAFMRQGIIFNLLFIPWFLAPEFSLILCLPLILMGTYFLIGLELIAEDIEDPFGWDGDDLPLDTICGTIRSSVSDILGMHKALKYTRSAERAVIDPLKH